MDITKATPVEIDTELAAIYTRWYAQLAIVSRESRYLTDAREGLAKAQAGSRMHRNYTAENVAERQAAVGAAKAAATAIIREADPFEAEFTRRGGWTRAYLVDNNGGHVHRSRSCSTCYGTTEFLWLPEYSGRTTTEVIEDAGAMSCLVCYAAELADRAEILKRRPKIEAPARRASRLEREARAKAKADKAARDGITNADGTPVMDYEGRPFKTERAAMIAAVAGLADAQMYREHGTAGGHPWEPKWIAQADRVIAAVAAKHGKTTDAVRVEVDAKVAAKRKRDERAA